MKVMRPEKCVELLEQHREVIHRSTAKLQIILEYFDELAGDSGEREFKNLGVFSQGIATICEEVIDGLWECEIDYIGENIKLYSPDPAKVINHVAYLKSIGIRDETTDIELADE